MDGTSLNKEKGNRHNTICTKAYVENSTFLPYIIIEMSTRSGTMKFIVVSDAILDFSNDLGLRQYVRDIPGMENVKCVCTGYNIFFCVLE